MTRMAKLRTSLPSRTMLWLSATILLFVLILYQADYPSSNVLAAVNNQKQEAPPTSSHLTQLTQNSPTVPDAQYNELAGFYVYIDPGHNPDPAPNVPDNSPYGQACRDRGAYKLGLYEGDVNLNIALALRDELVAHGAQVFMSRSDLSKNVALEARTDATEAQPVCSTYGNNRAYTDYGSPGVKWRFVSIHNNCCPGAGSEGSFDQVQVVHKRDVVNPLADDLWEKMLWQINRPFSHPNTPRNTGDWAQAGDPYVVRNSYPWQNNQYQQSYNILTESGFLDYQPYNTWIRDANHVRALAKAHYRALVDFWLVGTTDAAQSRNQAIFVGVTQLND